MQPANDDPARAAPLAFDDAELAAYAEGRLSAERRTAVEGYLACNPDLAARVMTARHMAGRAGAAPFRRRPGRLAVAAVSAAVIAGATGFFAAQAMTPPDGPSRPGGEPAYVEDGMMSQRTAIVRASMVSQVETPGFDAAEVNSHMRVRLPKLPADWKVVDAQVYPSDDGPALNLSLHAADRRQLNLFVVRADTLVGARPVIRRKDGEFVAYWEAGHTAFVLTGEGSRAQLLADATDLSRRSAS